MKLTKRKIIVIILAVILFIIFCPFAYLSPFKGKVIDADTKKPIEGAVVLVVYRREVLSIAGSNTYPADVQETLVDSNGEFKIPWRIRWFGKAKRWPEANVIIFKPGYGRFPNHKRSEAMGENKSWPSPRKYIVYKIPKLNTIAERKENVIFGRPYDEIPYQRRKIFFKKINEERKNLRLRLNKIPKY